MTTGSIINKSGTGCMPQIPYEDLWHVTKGLCTSPQVLLPQPGHQGRRKGKSRGVFGKGTGTGCRGLILNGNNPSHLQKVSHAPGASCNLPLSPVSPLFCACRSSPMLMGKWREMKTLRSHIESITENGFNVLSHVFQELIRLQISILLADPI